MRNQKLLFGFLIIFFGLLLLLYNIHLFNLNDEFWWGLAFVALGLVFLSIHRRDSNKKGPVVFGAILLILGIFTILDSFAFFSGDVIGALFLWILATVFILIYIKNNERWWALIPGGILFILGFIVLIDEFRILDKDLFGFIFLFGLSLIFWFLFLIRDDKNKLNWAQIVAMIIMVVSFFVLSDEVDSQITDILFPISVIFCGGYLLVRGMLSTNKQTN